MRAIPLLFAFSLLAGSPALAAPTLPTDHGLFDNGAQTSGSGGMTTGGASPSNPVYVSPTFSGGANLSVSTAASYTPFPAQACKQLTIANNTGVTVQVQQGGSGAAQPVFPGTYYVFYGLTDASALAVERSDGTATAVTVNARCEY